MINNDGSPNRGSILTLGDGAVGLLAQSIGDGGGRVGGAAGNSGSAAFSQTVRLGANAGSGGTPIPSGPVVNVTNSGPILTFGTDAAGIVAQSIGGGGGLFGKSVSSIGSKKSSGDGGNGVGTAPQVLQNLATNVGLAALSDYSTITGLVGLANTALGNPTPSGSPTFLQLLSGLSASAGSTTNSGSVPSLVTTIGLGATGGSLTGGTTWDGAGVLVTNNSDIATAGRMSEGILAQSIGGGGGSAGIANSAQTSGSTTALLVLGASGGPGGMGGAVDVENLAPASVTTVGGTAPGIIAQSIGGGGGMASLSGNSSALLGALTVQIGGIGNVSGGADNVTVNNGGTITTLGHDAPAIVAQSVGGGGGLVRTLASDLDSGGSQVTDGGSYNYNLTFGAGGCGSQCQTASAGPVTVTNTGSIVTQGKNAYGILAQSIGGGGGAVLGGVPNGSSFFGPAAMNGNGRNVTVTVGNTSGSGAGNIFTTGQGAVAILAQSIGGGGGLAGDVGLTSQRSAFSRASQLNGTGGAVTVTVNQSATVSTQANNTPVILAQSIGGGGGRITNNGFGAYDGTAGGIGGANPVTVNVYGKVLAAGKPSPGIFAESVGNGGTGSPLTVNIYSGGMVKGGQNYNPGDGYGAGVYLVGGGPNSSYPNVVTIQSGGTLTNAEGRSGTAVYSTGGYTEVVNSGTLVGDVNLANGGGTGTCTGSGCPGTGNVVNAAGGLMQSASIRLGGGTLANAGVFDARAGGSSTATFDGNYHALAGGVLHIGADFAKGTADQLTVTGNAQLDSGSAVRVDVASYTKGTVPILTVNGTLTNGSVTVQASKPTYLFGLQTAQAGSTLQVQTVSNLRTAPLGLTSTQQSVANILDQLWQSGTAGFATGAASLATVGDARSYRVSLNSLAGASAGGVAAAKQAASERFSDNLINCEPYRGAGQVLVEQSCIWLRSAGTRTSLASARDASGYRQDSALIQLGGQRDVAPGWFLGASAGYDTSWLVGNEDGTKVSGQSALFGLMVKYQTGPWVFSGVVDGGYGWYRSNRQILVGTTAGVASGSPNVSHAGIHGRVSYQAAIGSWYARPNLTVSALYRGMPGYSENGTTPFNLVVKSSSGVVGAAEPNLEIGKGGKVAGLGMLRGFVGVGAAVYVNSDWTSRAAFQLAPSGTFTATARQPAAVAKLRAGLDLFTAGNLEAKLTYDAHLAPGYTAQSFMGRLALVF